MLPTEVVRVNLWSGPLIVALVLCLVGWFQVIRTYW